VTKETIMIAELQKKVGALADQNRALLNKIGAENRAMTEDEATQFDNRQKEIVEIGETIQRARDQEQLEARLAKPENAPQSPEDRRSGRQDDPTTGRLASIGELTARAVMIHKGRLEARSDEERSFSMAVGTAGGIMVPTQFVPQIMEVKPEAEVVMPGGAFIFPAGDPPDAALDIPAFTQGDLGAMGGITVYWGAEAGDVTETAGELGLIRLEPRECTAYIKVTDKLLRNAPAFAAFIDRKLPQAVVVARDLKFIKGSGVGCPLGAWNADCRALVNREVAGDFTFNDAANMLGSQLPDSWGTARWVFHVTLRPKVVTMQDSAGRAVFIAGDASKGVPDTLFGLPIRWTGRTYALGTQGDAALMDFSYYLVKPGYGPMVSYSEHVKFLNNQTVIKVVFNVDGQPWMKQALTLDDGSTQVSPFVILK